MIRRVGRRLRRELDRLERRGRLPDRAVLLLTNPRSGSTWLFDALRCHPGLVVHAEADLWEYFDLHGRRYPRDLSGDQNNAVRIEVQPGTWELLPRFALPSALTSPARMVEPYALEKCHPHFFDHDVHRFVARLREMNARGSARVIYQVRDPRASIVSFLRYKERNPTWNTQLAPEQVIPHMRRIFASLSATAAAYPGLIVDYDDLERDTQATLKRIFAWLWPGKAPTSDAALLTEIIEATGRGKRSATPFLGAQISEANDATYAPLFAQFAEDLAACYTAYDALRAQAAGTVPA
jgi:hypothetical protein